jgi:CHAT domain-containing protein
MATTTFLYLGAAHVKTSSYNEGIKELMEARRLARLTDDRQTLASALSLLSNVYLHLSSLPAAERMADEALLDCAPDSPQMAALLIQKGRLAARAGELSRASAIFKQAAELARKLRNRNLQIVALRSLGQYRLQAGLTNEALPPLLESLDLATKADDPSLPVIYSWLTRLELAQGTTEKAQEYAFKARETYAKHKAGLPGWSLDYLDGRLAEVSGHPDQALASYRQVLKGIASSGMHRVAADALRVTAVAWAQDEVYSHFIDTAATAYLRSPDPKLLEELITVAETHRAQALRVTAAGSSRLRRLLPPEYFETLTALQNFYSENYREDSPAARAKADALRLKLSELEMAAGMADGPNAALNLKALESRLGSTDVLLGFHLAKPHSYLWILTAKGVTLNRLPAADVITAKVRGFRAALESTQPDLRKQGAEIYATLFRDLPPEARTAQRWLIMPSGALFQLPFAALRPTEAGSSGYLVERNAIQLLPGTWMLMNPPADSEWTGPFLGVGDPIYNTADSRHSRPRGLPSFFAANAASRQLALSRLPNTATELATCARALNDAGAPRMLLGAEAHWADIRKSLELKPAVVHLATHVVPSPDSADESLLALSLTPKGDPELLTPELIAANDINARLIVLSGCRSGLGNVQPGEGLMGLTRACLLAGARAVVATYWPTVDDSGDLLQSFYSATSKGKLRPAFALQAAQKAMIANKGWQNEPRYWAAHFVSSGQL